MTNTSEIMRMSLLNKILERAQYKKRDQISKFNLDQIIRMIEIIILKYSDGFKGMYGQTLNDLYTALTELDKKEYLVVPEDIKNVIIDKVWFLKMEAARLLVEHFKVNEYEFEEGDDVFNTLKDAVITHGGFTNVGDQ